MNIPTLKARVFVCLCVQFKDEFHHTKSMCLCVSLCPGPLHQVFGSSQAVLVREGDEAILPCQVEPPVNMERRTVEWSRADLQPAHLLLYRDGRYLPDHNPSYNKRASLFLTELCEGNISLKLSRVRLSDQGIYTCSAPQLKSSSHVQLLVGKTYCSI